MGRDIVLKIESILIQNRYILKEYYDAGNRKIPESDLLNSGYDFTYHTSKLRHENGKKIFWFCYEFGIVGLDETFVEIIKIPQ